MLGSRRLVGLVALVGAGMFLLPGAARGEGTEATGLGPPAVTLASGTGIATGGAGLDDVQPASFSVTVPAGAVVNQVLLYWACHHKTATGDNEIRVSQGGSDHDVTGTTIGGPTHFFNNAGASVKVTSFRADITALSLVGAGTTTLSLSQLACDFENQGGGVVVIYDEGTTAAELAVRDGLDLAAPASVGFTPPLDRTVPVVFNFVADTQDRTAPFSLMVGSVGENRPNVIKITVNGTTTTLVNQLHSADGPLWDAYNGTVFLPGGTSSVTIELAPEPDGSGNVPASMAWVNATLTVPPPVPPPPPPPPSQPGRMTGGGKIVGSTAYHGFELHCDASELPNNLEINWGVGNNFHLDAVTTATCTDDPNIVQRPPVAPFDTYEGTGTGTCNNLPATIEWTFTDQGEPGSSDTADIEITGSCTFSITGPLQRGNHRSHRT